MPNAEAESHRARIYAYIRSMIRDDSEADDLTQEALFRAHHRRQSLRDPQALLAWLYRVATRVTLDRLRQKARRATREYSGDFTSIDLADTRYPTALKVLEQKQMSACVQNYIGELTDEYRAVILLHDLHGLTAKEIAEILGVSLAAVKIRLHRARRKLQKELGQACQFSFDENGNLICEPKR